MLTDALKDMGFEQSQADSCVLQRMEEAELEMLLLVVHVDDHIMVAMIVQARKP